MELLFNGLAMDASTIKDVEIFATMLLANKIKLEVGGVEYKPVVRFEEAKK